MRYPENAVPLIVVGRPRAGTRFLVDALNKFPEISVQGELPISIMKFAVEFVERSDAYYKRGARDGGERKQRYYENWLAKKQELLFGLWANAGQARHVKVHKNCRYFGYKRPNHEMYFDFYEKHFETVKPFYVYCTRNFKDNYLSIVARWPDRSIRKVAKEYLASIEQYRKMKREAPERVLKFVLDEFKSGGVNVLQRHVLEPLRVQLDPVILDTIDSMEPKNTAKLHRVDRRNELTAREEKFIARRPELQAEFESLLD